MVNHTPVVNVGGYDISKSLLLDLTKIRAPYDNVPLENARTGKKLELDWKLHMLSDESKMGYDGALFSTSINGEPHYFIYHQGANSLKDAPSIARLANGKPPQQMREACEFSDKAMEYIAARHPNKDVPVAQVGFSLGGAMAMIACRQGQPVITFDAPGTKKLIESQGRNPEEIGAHVLEVLSPHPNAINAHEEHIGAVIEAGEKYWKTDKASVGGFIRMSVETHRMRNIGLGLASMDDFTTTPAKDLNRPHEVFDAFAEYVDDSIGENPELGERILANTLAVMDTLWIDKLITKVMVVGADKIGSKISKGMAEGEISQPQRPVTPKEVEKQNGKQPAAPAQEQQQDAAQPAQSYVKKVVDARQQSSQQERGI